MAEMVRYGEGSGLIRSMADAERAATAMARSGYFTDAKDAAQAVVKILAGAEMGFGPFAAMTGIHIIQGRPAVGAHLMAAAVKAHPRYDYRVMRMDDDAVTIQFYQDGKASGVSAFTLEDARKAGTKNLDKYPRNMLFARAMSNGVRWYTPDVFTAPTYTPEELGADVDADGCVVEVTPAQSTARDERPDDGPDFEDGSEGAPAEAHWIDDSKVRSRFWAWVKSEGLHESDVHIALEAESVRDFSGSMSEARALLEDYIARVRDGDADEDDPERPF